MGMLRCGCRCGQIYRKEEKRRKKNRWNVYMIYENDYVFSMIFGVQTHKLLPMKRAVILFHCKSIAFRMRDLEQKNEHEIGSKLQLQKETKRRCKQTNEVIKWNFSAKANSAMQLWKNILCISLEESLYSVVMILLFCIVWYAILFIIFETRNFQFDFDTCYFPRPNFIRSLFFCRNFSSCHETLHSLFQLSYWNEQKLKRTSKRCVYTITSVNTCNFSIQSNNYAREFVTFFF